MVSLNPQGRAVLAAVDAGNVYRIEMGEGRKRAHYQSYRRDVPSDQGSGNVTRTVEVLAFKSDPPLIKLGDRVGNRRRWFITPDGERVLAALGGRS
jgi:hypothetical protein